jgi:flavin-dependent dehydrogenase
MDDVVICGGGPAGSVAAYLLAKAGARVRLLDRAVFPRDKLCGDTVNPGTVALLRRHGLGSVVEDGLPVDGMIVTGASGVRIEGRYGPGVQGRAIARRVLDERLLAAAAGAGATVCEGVLVRAPLTDAAAAGPRATGVKATAGGADVEFTARVVIAADGRHSRVARALGLSLHPPSPRRWAVGGYFEGVAALTTLGEMHVRHGRYLGVAPLPGGLANACVVTADRAALRDPRRLLVESLRRERVLGDRFARARLVGPAVCIGPLAVEARAAGIDGLLLAGDAAGFIDPMTGDGLRFAIRGAELASAAALSALEQGWTGVHARLADARRREFGGKWRFNRALRALVDSRALGLADRGASIAPAVVTRLIRYAGDAHAA